MTREAVLVDPKAIPDGAMVVDVRWTLGNGSGQRHEDYLAGHVPGARFLDLDVVLTGPKDDPTLGRHPLPEVDQVAAGLGALGVEPGQLVVVYDQPGSFAAGRAWWVLAWAGVDVRILDGGITAWVAAGLPLETGEPPAVQATHLELSTGHLPVISADQAANWPGSLIDARAGERYRGDTESVDPVAGHIPGAINRPVGDFFGPDGRLPDETSLRTLLAGLSDPVAVYCGSGVSAAQVIVGLTVLGIDAALYPPSWSGWIADEAHGVAVGAD